MHSGGDLLVEGQLRAIFESGGWAAVSVIAEGSDVVALEAVRSVLVERLFRECFEPNMIVRLADAAEVEVDLVFLAAAVGHYDWQVRVSAVTNEALPAHMISPMCHDSHPSVRAATARHPLCPTEYLSALIDGGDPAVTVLLGEEFIDSLHSLVPDS